MNGHIAPWKIAFAVWLPIIVIGISYGAAYVIRYKQAHHAEVIYNQKVQACEDKVRSDNAAALARGDTSHGVETCQVIEGGTTGVAHGFLGLPLFEVAGMPDNSGNYPPN